MEKKKRGRPKKVQLPEEIQTLVDETLKEIPKPIQETKPDIVWDVPLGQEIKYFDPRLSYEITGYRPITKDKGLDFNPEWFTEPSQTFLRTGHYTQYKIGTKAYADFWNEEYRRCKNGMTVNGYTITGDNYFFLNYFQLMDLDNTTKAGGGRSYIFPVFYNGQYELFHYIELCRKLRLNACIMKSREIKKLSPMYSNIYSKTPQNR